MQHVAVGTACYTVVCNRFNKVSSLRCLLQVRCVRADLATRVDFQPNSPALIFYPYKQRAALAGWIADERSSTFVAVSHDGSPQVLEGYRLKEPEQIRREKLQREGVQEEQTGKHTLLSGSIQATEHMSASYSPRLLLPNPRMTRLREFDAGLLALRFLLLIWSGSARAASFTSHTSRLAGGCRTVCCRHCPCPADVPVCGQDQPAAAQPAAYTHSRAGSIQTQPG